MKSRRARILLLLPVLLALFLSCVQWRYGSGSIYADLRESLEDLHGRPYAGQVVSVSQKEGQSVTLRENLAFSIEPASRLALRPWLAVPLGLPYGFSCEAVYTRTLVSEDGQILIFARQVYAYDGWDDGDLTSPRRAWIDQDSRTLAYSEGEALFADAS